MAHEPSGRSTCTTCGQSFNSDADLREHERTAHGQELEKVADFGRVAVPRTRVVERYTDYYFVHESEFDWLESLADQKPTAGLNVALTAVGVGATSLFALYSGLSDRAKVGGKIAAWTSGIVAVFSFIIWCVSRQRNRKDWRRLVAKIKGGQDLRK